MKVIASERLPIKLWVGNKEVEHYDGIYTLDIEDGALAQAKNLANLPFAFKHIAIMPDTHEGYGMPIGGVLATKGVVIPNAVGVDIGCGMCAAKITNQDISEYHESSLKFILGKIRETIPVGFNHYKEKQSGMPLFKSKYSNWNLGASSRCIIDEQWDAATYQLGTLGGGNHFIEIQADEDNNVWVMIHSGSRNLGKQVADYYNKIAKQLNEKWFSSVDSKWDLAFLPIETDEGKHYMEEMHYCVSFAYANRMHMMRTIQNIMNIFNGAEFGDAINIAHNYAAWENHFGQNVVVHRKGATRARKGEIGIIPGSMGTNSYIVEGLGNAESFTSCSHGAGRKMGRKEATKRLDLSTEIGNMDGKGIIHGLRNNSDLDEAPGAYKEIDVVMENQKDLVTPIVKLRPLAVIKG